MTLKDVFDKDTFIIEGQKYTDDDYRAMSLDDLRTIKIKILKKNSGINASLKEKEIECSKGGEKPDDEWYRKRRSALSINNRMLKYVNILIEQQYRKLRSFGDFFMEQAKAFLPNEDYRLILRNAQMEKERIEREGSVI